MINSLAANAVDGAKDLARQVVFLKQSMEFQQGVASGVELAVEVDADESADHLTVVNCIANAFAGPAKTLLGDVYAQHALNVFEAEKLFRIAQSSAVEGANIVSGLACRRSAVSVSLCILFRWQRPMVFRNF